MRFRLPRPLIAFAAVAVLLVGCASDDPQEPPTNGVEDPTTQPGTDPGQGEPGQGEPADPEPDPAEPEPEPAEPDPEPVEGDCSASGADIQAPALTGIPANVVALRDFLLDAALRCDEQLLQTAIEESNLFTYSFGGGDDALGYWWDLEAAGEQPFLRLAQVLATTPAIADGGEVVVWPQVTTGRDENTTPEAWAELTWLTDAEIAANQGEAGYLEWRAGISTDGEWRFFVRGD